jgi:hypothetical protein
MWFSPTMISDKVDWGLKIILNLVWFWSFCPIKIYFMVRNEFLKAYMMVFNVLDKKSLKVEFLRSKDLDPIFLVTRAMCNDKIIL